MCAHTAGRALFFLRHAVLLYLSPCTSYSGFGVALSRSAPSQKPRKKTSSAKAAEQTAPPKAERASKAESPSVIERIFSPEPGKPATPPRSVATTKSKDAKQTAQLKATTQAKPKAHAEAKTAADTQTHAPVDAAP